MVEYEDLAISTDGFQSIGEAFEETVGAATGMVGAGTATLLDQPNLVDFGVGRLADHR